MGQTHLDATTDRIKLVASNQVREDSGMIRFDYRFNDRSTMYARYNIDDVYIDNATDALGSPPAGGRGRGPVSPGKLAVMVIEHDPSHTLAVGSSSLVHLR